MSHLTPNTAEATAKLLRTLTSNLSTQSTTETPRDTFISATTATSESLLTNLTPLLTTATAPQTLNNALQTLFNLSNTLPPGHLASHWRTLCQRVLSLSKQSPHPRTLITLASLIIASIPLSALGAEQRAVVAAIAQQSLQHAQATMSQHPVQSLCLILAVIHGAPRELRAQALEEQLQALFSHPERKIRTLAATVSAELVTCVSQKQQTKLFSERVTYVQGQVEGIITLLNAFATGKYDGDMGNKTPAQVCDHLDGVCMLVVNLLDLSIRAEFPLRLCLKTLCDGMRERIIDPYTVVQGVKMTHDDLLVVMPQVQLLCARTIADITERIPKAGLQMFIKEIGTAFEMRLSKLLLRSRQQSGLACIGERGHIYSVISRLVSSLGTGFLDFCVPRLQELFEIDLASYERCVSGEKVLKVDPESNLPSGGKSRKRRRHNGRREGAAGSHVLTKEHVQGLASVYGKETLRSAEYTINAALDVITRIFNCRGLLVREVRKHLAKLEGFLSEMLNRRKLSPALLRAITSAAVSGGSQRMTGEASSLFEPTTRVSVIAALDTTLSPEERNLALTAKSGCEAMIHPCGPAYARESSMYSTLVGNERIGTEKLGTTNDPGKMSGKLISKQNENLRGVGETTGIEQKEVPVKDKRAARSDEVATKNQQQGVKNTPAKDLMEVDYMSAMKLKDLKEEKDSSRQIANKGKDLQNTIGTKESKTEKSSIHKTGDETDRQNHPNPSFDKRIIEARRTEPTVFKELGKRPETTAGNVNGAQRHPVGDSEEVACASGTKQDEKGEPHEDDLEDETAMPVDPGDRDSEAEEKMANEDQALIDGLVFESSDEE